MTSAAQGSAAQSRASARFRYGVVFLLILALLVFEVLSPDTDWARAVATALAGSALTVAVATARARRSVRRLRARVAGAIALIIVVCVGAGVFSATVAFLVFTLLLAALPVALTGGLLRLTAAYGVTIQAVAGALTIYLLIGLLFASAMGFVSHAESGRYFVQTANEPTGVRVYYSFTALTSTGFGDYTPAQPGGRALAVLEMLAGQLYLVTVIGIIVANFTGRRIRSERR